MDRIYLAIIASAVLLLIGTTGLYVMIGDLTPVTRTIGAARSR